ncbi:MAG: MerR family transcriptional regulator [Colwellia sp.]|nr:MerR family transcriptional regulator [Colwellia sp.]
MNKKDPPLTIGRLAKAAKVNIETIRHYQRKTLIVEPEKPLNGFRHYPVTTIDELKFIKRAQQLGFSLKEIKQLLLLGEQHCHDVQQLAIEKRAIINRQISGLQTIQTALDQLIEKCYYDDTEKCSLIKTLSEQGFLED